MKPCFLGLHSWDHCQCNKCGAVRDEHHDWSKDCERCSTCGKVRREAHKWDGPVCKTCNKQLAYKFGNRV